MVFRSIITNSVFYPRHKMNSNNIRLVARLIRTHESEFSLKRFAAKVHPDSKHFRHNGADDLSNEVAKDCGAVCCICGWVNVLVNFIHGTSYVFLSRESAAAFMGISDKYAAAIFTPTDRAFNSERIQSQLLNMRISDLLEQPWILAAAHGWYTKRKSPFDATAIEAATVLEAIADGLILGQSPTPVD